MKPRDGKTPAVAYCPRAAVISLASMQTGRLRRSIGSPHHPLTIN